MRRQTFESPKVFKWEGRKAPACLLLLYIGKGALNSTALPVAEIVAPSVTFSSAGTEVCAREGNTRGAGAMTHSLAEVPGSVDAHGQAETDGPGLNYSKS